MTKILYLKSNEIDKARWDGAIDMSLNGNVYAYAAYLDMVSPRWEALVSEDYASVFPLTVKNKFGVKYLCQPPFAQQLGVFSKYPVDNKMLSRFLSKIPLDFKLVEINLNTAIDIEPEHFNSKVNATYELDLNPSFATLQKAYSENLKRNLKKAVAADLIITQSIAPDTIIELFRQHRGKHIKTLSDTSYSILKKIIKSALKNNKGELVGALDNNNELNGAAFFITDKGKSVFLFSALSEKGKQNAAMPFIINSFIEKNAGKNLILDFEGSNDENLARFYKSFGAKKNTYLQITLNKMSYIVKVLFKLYKGFKNH